LLVVVELMQLVTPPKGPLCGIAGRFRVSPASRERQEALYSLTRNTTLPLAVRLVRAA